MQNLNIILIVQGSYKLSHRQSKVYGWLSRVNPQCPIVKKNECLMFQWSHLVKRLLFMKKFTSLFPDIAIEHHCYLQKLDHKYMCMSRPLYLRKCSYLKKHFDNLSLQDYLMLATFPSI